MTISVYWWATTRMSFSCCHMLNEIFDAYRCEHYDRTNPPPTSDGCILVFHGEHESTFDNGPANADRISLAVREYPWVIFVSIGDEATRFPSLFLQHHNCRRWIQAPRRHTDADRYLIQGYPDHTRMPDPAPTRDLDYFFGGQLTHDRRHQCHAALARYWETNPNGLILGTAGFGQGLPFPDYLHNLARCRIAPCPAGPATVDTFRVYEALEMGAIPLLDSHSLDADTADVWPKLLGRDHPLPIISEWDDLPRVMDNLLSQWDIERRVCQAWWRAYKRKFNEWLAHDILSLNATPIIRAHGARL